MDKNYMLEKITVHFNELGLLTDYLKDQNVETLAVVEHYSESLAQIKRRCSALPPWATSTFNQILEDCALRATLMAGNIILLEERKEIIDAVEKDVESVEKKLKELYGRKEKVISILNTLKALSVPSDALESQFEDLSLSEKKMEKKKFEGFAQIEREIESLLEVSSEVLQRAEEERKKSMTKDGIETISEIEQYTNMISQLEALGVDAKDERDHIEAHKKALLTSDYQEWSQIFYALRNDTETLRNRIALAEELQACITELERSGMDSSLEEPRTYYRKGDLLRAEHELKVLKETYEKMREEAGGRRKIAEEILQQCERMLRDLPPTVDDRFATTYEIFRERLKGADAVSEDSLDEMQALKTEIERSLAMWLERERKDRELKKMASEIREKITLLKKDLKKCLKEFKGLEFREENIKAFREKAETERKEIAQALTEKDKSRELPDALFRSLSNRLSHIDVRIEDMGGKIATYSRVHDLFVGYKESYTSLSSILSEAAGAGLEESFREIEEFLSEHFFDLDFPVEALEERIGRAQIDLKEKEIILRDSIRKIEKMKNELMIVKNDFALMGYSREKEYFEERMQKIFEERDILTKKDEIEKIENQKKELETSMKERLHKNIGNEIEILEKIRKEGNIGRHESFIEEIIEITEKYDFSDLGIRARKLIGRIEVIVRECPYLDCGEKIEGAAQFCPFCGRKTVLCQTCGKYNKEESKFCAKCGRLLKIEEYILETLEKGTSVSSQDLIELRLEEGEAEEAIQTFFDMYSPKSGELFGNPLLIENSRLFVNRASCEEKIRELLPIHGAISVDDLDECTQEDVLRFYEKYKDTARDELGYDIQLIGDMIVKR